MNRRSCLAVCFAATFAIFLATPTAPPAFARSNDINSMKASDAQLLAAISTLNNQVSAQKAALASAQQAVDAANQEVATEQAMMQQTQQQLEVLRGKEQQRAVELYMSPDDSAQLPMFATGDMQEAARRSEYASEVANNAGDVYDALKATQKQYDKDRKAALAAQKQANDRRDAAQASLNSLNTALANQTKLENQLKARIDAYANEDNTSAAGVNATQGGRASRGGNVTIDDSRVSAAGLQWPIHGGHPVTSPFGMRWGRMHEGIDIGVPVGTPIFASKAGTVSFAGSESGYGDYICIQHGGGFETCYAHEGGMSVHVGQQVSQGQQIGSVGLTGDATGANLHFETCMSTGKECFYGQFFNPLNYLP